MGENLLTKFLNLMSKNISESDLELIKLGKALGLDLISFAALRASQDDNFVDQVREEALERMLKEGDNYLQNNDFFYVGSIDFMVSSEPDGNKFFLLETNGGSHRGISILSEKQQNLLYNGYLGAIYKAFSNNKREDGKILILVGVPENDNLIHEKVLMIDYFRRKLKAEGHTVKIFNIDNFDAEFKAEFIFLIADYNQISDSISYSHNWVEFSGEKINLLIGDGIARRLSSKKFITVLKEDFRKLNTIIVNPIFIITDDKSLTYLSSHLNKKELEKYKLKYLLFTKAYFERDFINKVETFKNGFNKSLILKPVGGSGGAGVMQISRNDDNSNIRRILEESKKEFYNKFKDARNPFPYTLQEKAEFSLIDWNGEKHTFDIRIYLAQKDNRIIPIGGLARISRTNFINGSNKEEFVVNLSGYNGKIEVERGIGFSKSSCKILNLTFEDFVNMFCLGCTLFKSIVQNYKRIVNYSNWNKVLE
ncbi:MAG: hypothetical protein ACFFBY_00340 [Promethearchaeota archaeon]